jgi:hypothetical protein
MPRASGGEVDVRVRQRRTDIRPANAAAVPRRHGDQIHVFLMIGAVVLHDV